MALGSWELYVLVMNREWAPRACFQAGVHCTTMWVSNGETKGETQEVINWPLSTASVGPGPKVFNCETDCVPSYCSQLCISTVCSALEPACPGPHGIGTKARRPWNTC